MLTRRSFVQALALAGGGGAAGGGVARDGNRATASARASERNALEPADTTIVNGLDVSNLTLEYLDKTRQAGVACWHKSMAGLRWFADAHAFADANPARVRIVTTVREIRQAEADGIIGLVLGWQAADVLDSGAGSTVNDWWSAPPRTELPAYYHLGLRVCGIANNVANVFGGGCLEGDVPLTRAGRGLVEQLHKLRIVLDVGGHTGERTSLDAIAVSRGVPVVCTHTNVAALNDNPRATSNRVLEAIAKTGGVIGLTAINDFINRSRAMANVPNTPLGGLDTLLDQYDYLRKLIGAEHLGLGPDFTVGHSPQRDTRLFPPESIDTGPRRYVKGFQDIADLPTLIAGLEQRGWSTVERRSLLGGNWLRVYQQVWGA